MKDVLVNFGPPFAAGVLLMALLALCFPGRIAATALSVPKGGTSAVAGMLGLSPAGPPAIGTASLAETLSSLPAILIAGVMSPAVAGLRFLAGLAGAAILGRIFPGLPSLMNVEREPQAGGWLSRLTGTIGGLLDRYLNSVLLATVAAGVIGFLIPDALVARWLGPGLLVAPILGALLALGMPSKGGAEVIVAATLLAKGADVSAMLALVLAAPLLNIQTLRQLAGSLSVRQVAALAACGAAGAIAIGVGASYLPGLHGL